MSPRKSRTAALQAAKALSTPKRQTTRTKKKPESRKKPPVKKEPASNSTKKNATESIESVESSNNQENTSKNLPETSRRASKRDQKRRKIISQERLLTVIHKMNTSVGERGDKRVKVDSEELPTEDPEQEPEPEPEPEPEISEQRTMYSCKFCNKDFSSAFILFLHIRIHEKVGSVNEPTEDPQPAEAKVDEYDDDDDDEPEIKEEVIEEITIPDSDPASEDCDPLQIENEPKTDFVPIINKNFVENLRKNLSLAMNRQIN